MLPHTFFRWLRHFEENEIPVLLSIFEHTWGWQQVFAQIPESRFIEGSGMSKNTVRKALRSLEVNGVIRRYRTGKGYNTETYFFLANERSDRLYQALLAGQMDIGKAKFFNSFNIIYPRHRSKANPKNGSKIDPKNGSDSAPNSRGRNGSKFEPMKKKGNKKTDSRKPSDPYTDSQPEVRDDSLNRLMINLKRRRAGYNGRPTPIRNAMKAAYADLQSLRQPAPEMPGQDHPGEGPSGSGAEPDSNATNQPVSG